MTTLRLTPRQLECAKKVWIGDTLTMHPYWNETSGQKLKLPYNPTCTGVINGRSQTGLMFRIGRDTWLDAAWFVFPDDQQQTQPSP